MKSIKLTAGALAVLLMTGISAAQAQQAFEERYIAARPVDGQLVPLPTLGIAPVSAVALDPDVAAQLTEAVQKEQAAIGADGFEIVTRANGAKINWALVVRNAPRTAHDAFTQGFTQQLITCLHSLPESVEVASLTILLTGAALDDQDQRDEALAAGVQMLANWRANRCATRRNELPFFEANRAKLTSATRGMLTEAFDPLVFRGQALLDLVRALTPVFFEADGFWVTQLRPRLHALFNGAVQAGLLTVAEGNTVTGELQTFWDWTILVVSMKNTVVRSFIETTAAGCVTTVAGLSSAFRLSRCVSDLKLVIVPLRIAGQDYIAIQRRRS